MFKTSNIIRKFIFTILIFTALAFFQKAKAQFAPDYRFPDSTFVYSHSPNKATFYSAVLPGLGQIYNKKYWKVPIIYAGFGGLIYYVNYNNSIYSKYKDAYAIKLRIEKGELGLEDPYPKRSSENLKSGKDTWRRYRDLSIIGVGLLYVLQILDANVDAHLFNYDVSNDLSFKIEPTLINEYNYSIPNTSTSLGLKCSINF